MNVTYSRMAQLFRLINANKKDAVKGRIIFSAESWPDKEYTLKERTYIVSSDNKAYKPNMNGYSIYGSSADGSDVNVRLDRVMAEEKCDVKPGWVVERCYMDDADYVMAAALENPEICPRCGNGMDEHPALSRRVSASICSKCGTEEALIDLRGETLYDRLNKWVVW